jgi:hypothetical protein
MLAKYHALDGNLYVLIYVGHSDDCLSIIKGYSHNAKGNLVFLPGDVFARHGTASERWNQHDIAKIGRRIGVRERERWARAIAESFAGRYRAGSPHLIVNVVTYRSPSAASRVTNMIWSTTRWPGTIGCPRDRGPQ